MMNFECRSGHWTLTRDDYDIFCTAYPRKDVYSEMIKAQVWLHSNASRRKTPRGMLRFLNNWMNGASDKPQGFIERHSDKSWAAGL